MLASYSFKNFFLNHSMTEDDISPKTKSTEIPFKFHWDESFIFRWVPFIFRWDFFEILWDTVRFRWGSFEILLIFFSNSVEILLRFRWEFSYIPFRLCWNSVKIPFTITSDELINWINRQKDQNRSQILKIKKYRKRESTTNLQRLGFYGAFFADYLFTQIVTFSKITNVNIFSGQHFLLWLCIKRP